MVASLWAITTTVLPRVSSVSAAWMSASFSGSMLAVASSKMTMGASFNNARAMEIRCFWPPESAAPPSPTIVLYPSGSASANSSTLARRA